MEYEEIKLIWSEFYKHFPREFAYESGNSFRRNVYAKDLDELVELAYEAKFTDAYVSVCTFENVPPDGTPWNREEAIADRIVFDVDVDVRGIVGFRLALKNTVKIVKWLMDKAQAYPLVKFSGSKGFHVEVPIPPRRVNSRILKLVGLHICKENDVRILDSRVWEVARVFRLPLTVNSKTNLYCVPLDPEKLERYTVEDVIRKAKRLDYDIPCYVESETLATLFDYYTISPPRDHPKMYTTQEEECYPPCISYLLKKAKDGLNLSHEERFTLATFLLNIGMPREKVIAVFSNQPDFDYEKTAYQVEHLSGVRGKGTFYSCPSCQTLRTWNICRSNCPVNHPLAYYKVCLRSKKSRSGDLS